MVEKTVVKRSEVLRALCGLSQENLAMLSDQVDRMLAHRSGCSEVRPSRADLAADCRLHLRQGSSGIVAALSRIARN